MLQFPCARLEDVGYSDCLVTDIFVALSRGQHEMLKAIRQGKEWRKEMLDVWLHLQLIRI